LQRAPRGVATCFVRIMRLSKPEVPENLQVIGMIQGLGMLTPKWRVRIHGAVQSAVNATHGACGRLVQYLEGMECPPASSRPGQRHLIG